MTIATDSDALVEDEWYVVRYSGEIPEVAFHSAVYHLTRDREGPQIDLSDQQHGYLVDAVKQRYIDIILRDLLPLNKNTSAYRGVRRSLINWKRYTLFCERYGLDPEPLKAVVGESLCDFLAYERREFDRGGNAGSLNCSWPELCEYVNLLGLDITCLPEGVRSLCRPHGATQSSGL